MKILFDKIKSNDSVFLQPEYLQDSVLFNAIESAKGMTGFSVFSDHKDVILLLPPKGSKKVWVWTSSAVRENTQKMIDICRFLKNQNIPKAEIYLKQEISAFMSDLYALASSEIYYDVKDEYSLRIFGLDALPESVALSSDEKIVTLNMSDEGDKKLLKDFYSSLSKEFGWTLKFDRKINEYFTLKHFALIKEGKIISNAAIGSATERFLRVKSIATLQDMRNQGYAFKVLRHTSAQILEEGKEPILYAHVGNKSAMALWSKSGYTSRGKLSLLKVEDRT